jgi:hypothetical protein
MKNKFSWGKFNKILGFQISPESVLILKSKYDDKTFYTEV